MEKEFDTWTDYDNWLIENYAAYNILELNEKENGKVIAVFEEKK